MACEKSYRITQIQTHEAGLYLTYLGEEYDELPEGSDPGSMKREQMGKYD